MNLFKGTIITILFFLSLNANSQSIRSISGRVVNSKNEPAFGNVVALSVTDSTVIKGSSFLDGKLVLTDINREDVIIKLTSIEFADTFINVKYKDKANVELGNIKVKENHLELNEVKVSSKVSLVRQKADGTLEVKVANTMLAASNSLSEILSKSPSLVVDANGISVFGRGQAVLYLNGVKITSEQFAAIPVSQIDKIEIISNPSAKYDAEGNAVVNIRTKRNVEAGYKGFVNQNVSYSDFAGFNTFTSSNLNYKTGKLSLLGNYSLQLGKDREILKTTRNRDAQADFLNSDLKTDWKRNLDNYSNYGVGMQYDINDKNYISAEYSGYLEKLGGNQESVNKITNDSGTGLYTSDIKKDNSTYYNSLSVNYNSVLDTIGSSLFIGTQSSGYKYDINDLIFAKSEGNNASSEVLKNLIDHKIFISSTQIDYTKVLSSGSIWETGAKISYVDNKSVLDFYSSPDGQQFTKEDSLSSDFKYVENISAAYLNYRGKFNDRFSYSIGARAELTDFSLTVASDQGQQVIKDNYLDVFPNASLNIKLSDKISLNTSYSSRINRVSYRLLNPNVIYQDQFTSIQGNPDLVPEKSQSLEMSTNYNSYSFKIGYDYTTNPIDAAALRGSDPNSYVLKGINLKERHNYFLNISKSISNKWLTSTNNVSVRYTNLIDDQYNFQVMSPRPQIYLYSNNTINVKNLFNIEVLAWYLGEKYYGLYYDKSRYNVTIGLEKSFFDKSLRCRLIANDIFHSIIASGDYNVGETQIYYNREYNTSYVRVALSYNFGKLKKITYKNTSTGESENDRGR
ncbi:outer membrane receptor protein involved in Fe transport [Flavobacterium sp. 9]|uniref:outer membrane beta-barrel protein n=1 Tax=Flavobacterium sp. 9 TaxID=2035198 RepID=UPI000C17BCA8|nr:outer membrane beta-barrel protein [Flavobacterium sp. 9]PIF30214.1 outer membrane receptor protein involved in Fe transport [Flavobacterium sp. 9]